MAKIMNSIELIRFMSYESALEKLRSRSFPYGYNVCRLLCFGSCCFEFYQGIYHVYTCICVRSVYAVGIVQLGRACSNLCKSSTSEFRIVIAKKIWWDGIWHPNIRFYGNVTLLWVILKPPQFMEASQYSSEDMRCFSRMHQPF